LPIACVVFALAAFLLAPGGIDSKTHLALHGLCAQRPSHSLQIGGTALPLDARMTGIYLGAAVTGLWLLVSGRLRARRVPPAAVVALLVLFVALMAVDGFNALLVDLGAPHPYEPSNLLRLLTGTLAGIALGVMLGHLFAVTLWADGDDDRAVVSRPVEMAAPLAIAAGIGGLAWWGLAIFYAPFAVGLVVAAVGVFWMLSMVMVSLLWNRAWTFRAYGDLAQTALIALIAAAATIGVLAAVRLVAEQFVGLPKLT
jgi:uncharacterized membrane protein